MPLKKRIDRAIEGTSLVETVLVAHRTDAAVPMQAGRDHRLEQVRHAIGAFAAPDVIHLAAGLPKTRSGKIMRRVLRKVAASEYTDLGDLSTLAEPEVVERLVEEHKRGLP